MKFAIIGKGTSALVSSMIVLRRGHQVEHFYDPDTPFLRVGESTTPHVSCLMRDVLGMCIGTFVDDGIVSYKNGVHFVDWGVGGEFTHPFNSNHNAFHLDNKRWNDYVIGILESKRGVKFHPERYEGYEVTDHDTIMINGKEFDFIINCSGWQDDDSYDEPLIETVNSALLHHIPEMKEYHHTIHLATKHGWQFQLPFPELNDGESHCGYLYNNKLTSDEEAVADLKRMYGEDHQFKMIKWKPRFARQMIKDRYEAFQGNRLFFLEPLQALSLDYYKLLCEDICDFAERRDYATFCQVNQKYRSEMIDYQYALALHYQFGSVYGGNGQGDSKFWNWVTPRARHNLKFHPVTCDDKLFFDFMNVDTQTSDDLSTPYQWKEQIRPEDYTAKGRPNVGHTLTTCLQIAGFNYFDTKTLYCGFNQIRFLEFEDKYKGLPRNE